MKSSFYRRENAAFFSYSSKDGALASAMVNWLSGYAKLGVWFDAKDLDAGRAPAVALRESVGKCRAYVLLVTPNSLRSNWVAVECAVAEQESAEYNGFKVIAMVTPDVGDDDIPPQLRGVTRIQLPGPALDGRTAAKLLSSLRPEPSVKQGEDDVFVTRTWQEQEPASGFADVACQKVAAQGFRLVGDEPRADDDEQRLRDIVSSCASYLALIPPREPADLRWLLKDLNVARNCGLPVVIVADSRTIAYEAQGLLVTDGGEPVSFHGAIAVLPADMSAPQPDAAGREAIGKAINLLGDVSRRGPQNPYSVFYASSPGRLSSAQRGDIDRIVSSITGRRCIYPDDIDGPDAYQRTVRAIAGSVVTIADIGSDNADGWVYAGVASGARRRIDILTPETDLHKPDLFGAFKPRPYASACRAAGPPTCRAVCASAFLPRPRGDAMELTERPCRRSAGRGYGRADSLGARQDGCHLRRLRRTGLRRRGAGA